MILSEPLAGASDIRNLAGCGSDKLSPPMLHLTTARSDSKGKKKGHWTLLPCIRSIRGKTVSPKNNLARILGLD